MAVSFLYRLFPTCAPGLFASIGRIVRPRMRESLSCAISWPCCAARSRVPASAGPTVLPSPPCRTRAPRALGIVPRHAADSPRVAPVGAKNLIQCH